MVKTIMTKKLYRDLVKKRVQSEMRVLKARIRHANAKNNYEVHISACIEQHGSRPNTRLLRRMKAR